MALITSEKRFGPKFSTGREEEPGPTAYALKTDFDVIKAQKASKVAYFGTEARAKPPPKSIDFGSYNSDLPGAFPNVYTVDQWETQQKLVLEESQRVRNTGVIPSSPPKVHLAAGPGTYETELDMLKESRDFHFGKAKRLDMTEYMAKRGEVGASPGPKYNPETYTIAHQASTRRASSRQGPANDPKLDPTFQAIDKKVRKLNSALTSPTFWAVSPRLKPPADGKQSGPGSYNSPTDFVKRTTKRGTFGTAKQMDMLSNLLAAGIVGNTPVGPGQYNVSADSFKTKTYSTRGGYVSTAKHTTTVVESMQVDVKAPSRMFDVGVDGASLPASELWRSLRKAPDPKKLGYDNGVPSLVQKRTTSPKKGVVAPPTETKEETHDDLSLPPVVVGVVGHHPVDVVVEPMMQLELPPESDEAISFEL
ncbi:Aste57867_17283 [Aphanomyces stellatus]|uniref:Aste57867_17283 protein n=1 Tax=Aphanomyces stellatus TaxID=120398 RepID=A0A485L7K6_9STRA|nr:hypothetical protein As57867_017224 [Aphanomyces stellatus]VFT94039.1 Aste57867_17283 [Aphanomyces stellatus]